MCGGGGQVQTLKSRSQKYTLHLAFLSPEKPLSTLALACIGVNAGGTMHATNDYCAGKLHDVLLGLCTNQIKYKFTALVATNLFTRLFRVQHSLRIVVRGGRGLSSILQRISVRFRPICSTVIDNVNT